MLKLVTAAERLAGAARKTSIVVAGRAKVGKTSLLLTLPEAETIALDFEAGLNAVEDRYETALADCRAVLASWPK